MNFLNLWELLQNTTLMPSSLLRKKKYQISEKKQARITAMQLTHHILDEIGEMEPVYLNEGDSINLVAMYKAKKHDEDKLWLDVTVNILKKEAEKP